MAPTSARLLGFAALVVMFLASVASFFAESPQNLESPVPMYISFAVIALSTLTGLVALWIARDFQRLIVFALLLAFALLFPFSHYLPSSAPDLANVYIIVFAVNLFSLSILIELVVGPSGTPFTNVGPNVENEYNISQSKLIATLLSFVLSWVGIGTNPPNFPDYPALNQIIAVFAAIPAGLTYLIYSIVELKINDFLYPKSPSSTSNPEST